MSDLKSYLNAINHTKDKLMDDITIFGNTKLSDVLKEIYENSKNKKVQVDLLVSDVISYISDAKTAQDIIPQIKDLLEVGSSADTDLYVNDVSIAAVGKIALGTAALCANWKDIGTSDIRIGYIYNGANNDASAGAATVTISYLQNNNLS